MRNASIKISTLAAMTLASSTALAQPSTFWVPPTNAPLCASLEAAAPSGRPLQPIPFNGQSWIEGRPGAEYVLFIRNTCPFRILAVVSVDGLDVLSGEPASYAAGGYVVEPGRYAKIPGWRKSNDQVAAFFFSSPSASYAERVGKGGNVGVIGAAFFQEKPQHRHPRHGHPIPSGRLDSRSESFDSAQGAPSAKHSAPPPAGSAESAPAPSSSRSALGSSSEPSLGTGHGRRIDSSVTTTTFNRSFEPFSIVSLRYESTQRLIEMGAIVARRPQGPDPFPAQPPRQPSYAPDPPDYRR